ncbi:WD40 repeat domain-containing protein, partial [Methanoregula sp. PtaB.Bin085]|uniref:WD40 repeat domain-containing protein n=1 Tax=Methanoregula sp. PtaB.Bin085 TaxID=1811680 RepID=UPI0025DF8B68
MMHTSRFTLLCVAMILLVPAVMAENTVQPLWTEPGTVGGQLYGVVISADGSTIVSGGDQVISLTRDGRKRWSGWSATSLDISRQGDYILTGKGTELRLLSGAGTLIWDRNMEIAVKDISLAPDLSFIAAAGGGKIRTLTFSGEGIASNDTMTINAVRIMPSGDRMLLSTSRDIQLMDPKLNREWADENLTQNLIAVAPDGSSFVTAFSSRIRMYTGNGTILWDKRFPVGDAQAMAYSRDGTTIVLALSENLLVLDRTGRQVWMANATDIINGVAVSDDG